MKYLSFFVLIILAVSCSDSTGPKEDEIFFNGEFRFFYWHSDFDDVDSMDKQYSYDVQGIKIKNNDTLLNGGKAIIANAGLEFSGAGYFLYLRGSLDSLPLDQRTAFGEINKWSLSGNQDLGIPGFNKSLYIPTRPEIIYPDDNSEIKISDGFELKWFGDSNNNQKVKILIDTSSTKNKKHFMTIQTNDDGTYFIKPGYITKSGMVEIILIKEFEQDINISGFKYKLLYILHYIDRYNFIN